MKFWKRLEDWLPLRISGWLRGLLPPFITRLSLLRGLTITMVINHVSKSWDDPPSGEIFGGKGEGFLSKFGVGNQEPLK